MQQSPVASVASETRNVERGQRRRCRPEAIFINKYYYANESKIKSKSSKFDAATLLLYTCTPIINNDKYIACIRTGEK